MELTKIILKSALILLVVALACNLGLSAKGRAKGQLGSVEFVARVAPTGGRPEPVRELTFYLLRRSLDDIQKEAEESEPKPELDRFADSLEVSPELKSWIKKNRTAELAGTGFIRRLKAADIIEVPEFWDAYLERNSGDTGIGFPTPKYKAQDARQNPEKYAQLKEEYRKQIRKFIESNPRSIDGIDVPLEAINPAQRWIQQDSELRRRIRKRTLDLAQTRYLAAAAESDLDGRGTFPGVPPGDYWLSTLDTDAVAGDARLRWDVPVTVESGQTSRVALSNLNAKEQQHPAR